MWERPWLNYSTPTSRANWEIVVITGGPEGAVTGGPEGADVSSNGNQGDECGGRERLAGVSGGGRGMMSGEEVRRYRRLTVTRLTVYVRRTVKVAKSTPDLCALTHGALWVDSLHTYCHLAPSVAIKRERVDRFWQTKAYINPWNSPKSDILLDFM